eukprot:CAMPEP_0167796996 /NCGR_PEP_ID=MMETSP0111_2-20121227/15387_1 /TAXON_ID=91324 /ORGANISM="Lotharella globosa, Strain CCCM811" /LENGTH=88 /DNA_ID=CAMNT_0007691009 /DNA_START=584 /DNA_END=850 /DNA_ORIENTATION=+
MNGEGASEAELVEVAPGDVARHSWAEIPRAWLVRAIGSWSFAERFLERMPVCVLIERSLKLSDRVRGILGSPGESSVREVGAPKAEGR